MAEQTAGSLGEEGLCGREFPDAIRGDLPPTPEAYQALLRDEIERNRLLRSELNHRIRNNLQILDGLMQLQLWHSDGADPLEGLRKAAARIKVISFVNDYLLVAESRGELEASRFLCRLASIFESIYRDGAGHLRFALFGRAARLSLNQAVPLGLVIFELVDNAYRHAVSSPRPCDLRLSWTSRRGALAGVVLRDYGCGYPAEVLEGKGWALGLALVSSLAAQLRAEMRLRNHEPGASAELRFEDVRRGG